MGTLGIRDGQTEKKQSEELNDLVSEVGFSFHSADVYYLSTEVFFSSFFLFPPTPARRYHHHYRQHHRQFFFFLIGGTHAYESKHQGV